MYKGDYSIGLDIGATSVGFSAIDEKYRPIRLKGKTVIGARLFKEGTTAAERRGFRTTRRRLKRRKWRLSLLEEIFDPYMAKVDPTFFARLKESNLSPQDSKKRFSSSLLFPDETDSAFYDKYPTIYHLRYHLMNDDRQFDLREIFLAIHHIVKYRGNFLNNLPVSNFSTDKINFEEDFKAINDSFDEIDPETRFQINIEKTDVIAQKLLDNSVATLDKQKEVAKILYIVSGDKALDKLNSSIAKQISKAILGYKFDLAEVLKITTEDKNKWKIQLSDENIDDTLAELTGELNEPQLTILKILSKLYSQITLNDIVPSGQILSESMIKKYDAHKKHLEMLKKYAKSLDRKTYSEVMEAYAEYIGNSTKKSGTASQEDFYKVVKRSLNNTQLAEEIKILIDQNQFMPKQRTNQNGVIPYQLHLKELERIIENQSKYYPWLTEPNPNEKRRTRAKYKLSELVAFRIPYYVGPLITKEDQEKSSGKSFAWMIRKAPGKITPWNFDEKVDRTESANQFIKRMTTKDTYLTGEDVLPDHSLLYERFKVLNELNMVRVNGSKLEVGEKQETFEKLFKAKKTVKASQLANLLSKGMANRPIITGLSDPVKFNNSFGTYIDFKKIFGAKIDDPNLQNDFEQIIEWITVFEDRNILKTKLQGINWLTKEQITDLIAKRYQGWGRLSEKLLCGLKNEKGESILDLMWNTQRTFMEIVNEPVFAEQIKNANQDQINDEDYESILADAYTSPQNKKAIRQVVKVVDDIVRAAGKAPKFISLEFAREDQRSHRTQSRLAKLKDIYETTAKELVANEKVRQELGDVKDLNDRLFLYFTQLGRDMYTGEPMKSQLNTIWIIFFRRRSSKTTP
jgi:CRISPR-associated endonuclease Csn1